MPLDYSSQNLTFVLYYAQMVRLTLFAMCPDCSCLLYKHVPLDAFPSALASQSLGSAQRPSRIRQPTADHPELVSINGRQVGD